MSVELKKEVKKGHSLYGLNFEAYAVCYRNDDVLFKLSNGKVAIVHLTWAGKREKPPWPSTSIYASLDEAMKVILADVNDWLREEEEYEKQFKSEENENA